MNQEKLPRELVWERAEDPTGDEPGEHLSEVARSAVADGQIAIVPDDALAHLDACEACARAVGESALLSARVGGALEALAPELVRARAVAEVPLQAARLPWGAIAAALALAALGALPALADSPVWLAELSTFATRTVPLLLRSGLAIARSGGGSVGAGASLASALVLMMAGFAVSRAMPRRSAS